MADALCGPSNPLQQFKQQSSLDRTLQQDRLTSRHSPAQNFRSTDANAGLLDPEFEAFQAGLPVSELPRFHQPQHPFAASGPSQTPSWAADFQRMQISSPPTFQQQPLQQPSPAVNGWAQGFREHIAQTAPRAQTSTTSPQAFQYMARYGGMNGFQSNFSSQPTFASNIQSKGKEPAMEQFDEAAFERAFDQASEDMMVIEPKEPQNEDQSAAYETGASTGSYADYVDQVRREAMAALSEQKRRLSQEQEVQNLENMSRPEVLQSKLDAETIERLQDSALYDEDAIADRFLSTVIDDTILNDQRDIVQPEDEQMLHEQTPTNDDDALAATAQELLEKVSQNKTDKFRNSQFLHLMRRLRDREVKVEGDQMVETATNASATATDRPLFNNSEQTPVPLSQAPQHVDTRPFDYDGSVIPPSEQDHDSGRNVNPRDGQAVVDMLNQHGDPAGSVDDIGTSPSRAIPNGVFYGDLRGRENVGSERPSSDHDRDADMEILSRAGWDPDFVFPHPHPDLDSKLKSGNAQPAPGLH